MAGATLLSLKGQTFVYNDVQFGGRDSLFKMIPPEYRVSSKPLWDSSGRTIIAIEYTFTISGIIFHNTKAQQEAQMHNLRKRLMVEGRPLHLSGMGLGFNTAEPDIMWGPKPVAFDWTPVGGTNASEFIYTITARGPRCFPIPNHYGVLEFNFDTTWDYDESGIATRVIRGHIVFAQTRKPEVPPTNVKNQPVRGVADELRRLVTVHLPKGFRRLRWNFAENEAKDRLDFTFVDRQFEAEPFPPGISDASGGFTASASGAGFAQGTARMAMTLKHAPGKPKALLLATFITMAAHAERQLYAAARKGRRNKTTVIPTNITVSPRFWSREASFELEWMLAGCVQDILVADGIWKPAPHSGWQKWYTSMDDVLGNDNGQRGWSQIGSIREEGAIINICQTQDQFDIGKGNQDANPRHQDLKFKFECPEIPKESSWLRYKVRLVVLREDKQTLHRKAVPYEQGKPPRTMSRAVRGAIDPEWEWWTSDPAYASSASEQHTIEYNGQPRIRVALLFNGLRVKHLPEAPILESIDGKAAKLIDTISEPAQVVTHILHCPVYFVRIARIYEVVGGSVDRVKVAGNPSICGAPEVTSNY